MKSMKWLLRRELWEHKGSMFWAPCIVALLMLAFMGGTMVYALITNGIPATLIFNGEEFSKRTISISLRPEMLANLSQGIANGYLALSVPLFGMLVGIVFFYCLSALHDERRDRSILFWKSLPVSDQLTVLSKVITAACVAPLITMAVATAMSVTLLLLGCAALEASGVNLFGLVLASPDLYLAPLRLVGLLPVYVLWALPTIGWLLMVSAWARSKTFLWAVGIPLLAAAMVKWLNFLTMGYLNGLLDADWFMHHVVTRGLGGLIPGMWFGFEDISPERLMVQGQPGLDTWSIFTQSWMTLGGPNVWIGALAGAAMIFAAIRLRRWRDEG
jgi:ABC-2 type transport system permease protein